MPLIESPEQAMRLARANCSDVSLYNEEKIIKGIQQDSFFDAMRDELPDVVARACFTPQSAASSRSNE